MVEWIVVATMLLVGFLLVIFLCVRLQILYMDINETKRLCIRVMSMYFDGKFTMYVYHIHMCVYQQFRVGKF